MIILNKNQLNIFPLYIKDLVTLDGSIFYIFNWVDSYKRQVCFSMTDESPISTPYSKFSFLDGSTHSIDNDGEVFIYESPVDVSIIDASTHFLINDLYQMKIDFPKTSIDISLNMTQGVLPVVANEQFFFNPTMYQQEGEVYSKVLTQLYFDASYASINAAITDLYSKIETGDSVPGVSNGLQILPDGSIGLGGTLTETFTQLDFSTNELQIGSNTTNMYMSEGEIYNYAQNSSFIGPIDNPTQEVKHTTLIDNFNYGDSAGIDFYTIGQIYDISDNGYWGSTYLYNVSMILENGTIIVNGTPPIDSWHHSSSTNFKGIQYFDNYSANFDERSLIDRGYLDTSLGLYATNASINTAAFAKNASLGLYVKKAGDTMSGILDVRNQVLIGDGDRTGQSTFPMYIAASNGLGWKVADASGLGKFELYVGYGGTNQMRLLGGVTLASNGQDLTLGTDNKPNAITIQRASGNVGIGNTNPLYTLDVSGNARISGGLLGHLKEASIGTGLFWNAGMLDVSVASGGGGGGGGVTQGYVDGSLATKVGKAGDTMSGMLIINASLNVNGQINGLLVNQGANSLIGNIAIGVDVLDAITTGNYNTAFGYQSLTVNTIGWYNTAIGYKTLYNNTGGFNHVAIGYQSLYSNTTGSGNTAIGDSTLLLNTTGFYNIAIGQESLYHNTVGAQNTAIGKGSLYNNGGTYSNYGQENTAIGYQSLYNNTSGCYNVAIGNVALRSNVTGYGNVALGYNAGRYEVSSNTFYVDNQNRTNTNGDKTGALLYGTFNAIPANQTLTINGKVGIGGIISPAYNLDVSGNFHITGSATIDSSLLVGSITKGANASIQATEGAEMAPALIATNWSVGGGWASSGGQLIKTGTDGIEITPLGTFNVIVGRIYKVVITVSAVAGTLYAYIGDGAIYEPMSPAGTFTAYVTAISTANLRIGSTGTATITSVSVKEMTEGTGVLTNYGKTQVTGLWSTGGVPVLNFTSQGNIGIGANGSNAGYKLMVGGSINTGTGGYYGAYFGMYPFFMHMNNTGLVDFRTDTAGSAPIKIRNYSSYINDSNYERMSLTGVAGTSIDINAESAGTGSANLNINLTPKGTGAVAISGALIVNGSTGVTGTATLTNTLIIKNGLIVQII